ncbi:MAG: pyridoxamine 5'-phosphate oxidase [Bacteroidales bacterium]|nr:pyridoxamine 5'-phosphate oxidase [Bacteroidales bacterium]NPV35294.1 pyridoxamine 5'-phosphate oxidase [Bacteroidales bacterium]
MSQDFFDHRRNYTLAQLSEDQLPADPFQLLEIWINEAIRKAHPEALAFVLSTSSTPEGQPSSRVVLLKQLTPEGLVFFTNYLSRKGEEIKLNPKVSAHFFWPLLERQIRIEGKAQKTESDLSDKYFDERPLESRIAAIVSPQSQPIPSRKWLEENFENFRQNHAVLKRPEYWGGYIIRPHRMEFWQGRPNRLHDRIVYQLQANEWIINRLAP